MMAERPIQDDNPAEKAAAKVEDQLEGFVQQTKENSGLFQDTISQQPGNKTGKKGSPVDESGQAGGTVLFTFGLPSRCEILDGLIKPSWHLVLTVMFRCCRGNVSWWHGA